MMSMGRGKKIGLGVAFCLNRQDVVGWAALRYMRQLEKPWLGSLVDIRAMGKG